jgi:hypothetical protein
VIWISLDPGEDTGWALWEGDDLIDAGTDKLWDVIDRLDESIGLLTLVDEQDKWQSIGLIVVEDWALYPWKVKQLAWDKCRTARGIGAIELIARRANVQIEHQPAKIKEGAIAGGARELFRRPFHENRHANDAIMHGYFYLQKSRAKTRART